MSWVLYLCATIVDWFFISSIKLYWYKKQLKWPSQLVNNFQVTTSTIWPCLEFCRDSAERRTTRPPRSTCWPTSPEEGWLAPSASWRPCWSAPGPGKARSSTLAWSKARPTSAVGFSTLRLILFPLAIHSFCCSAVSIYSAYKLRILLQKCLFLSMPPAIWNVLNQVLESSQPSSCSNFWCVGLAAVR